jgi:rSAM/selenodomain-associated transferase 1
VQEMADRILSMTQDIEAKLSPGAHAVVVMAKAPISGAVKSRLAPPLTEDEAAALNRCFIRDVCASIEAAAAMAAADGNARVVGMIAYTPAEARAAFNGLAPASFKFIEQRGDGLTARLTNVAADLLATGYESVSLMNSDSPTIPPALIVEAVTHLAQAGDDRLAIIGADDGGYCLIGLKRPHPRIFEDIAWSTGAVLAQTLQRAAELRLIVLQTPSWYDIDDAASLRRLIDVLFDEFSHEMTGETPDKAPPSEKSCRISIAFDALRRAPLIKNRRSSKDQTKNKKLQNKANFFTAPATRGWLSEALANGLAARLGLAPSAHSAGQSPRDRRSPDG